MRVGVPSVCYCAFIHFLYDIMNGWRGRIWQGFVEMYLLFRHVCDLGMNWLMKGGKRVMKVDADVIFKNLIDKNVNFVVLIGSVTSLYPCHLTHNKPSCK